MPGNAEFNPGAAALSVEVLESTRFKTVDEEDNRCHVAELDSSI